MSPSQARERRKRLAKAERRRQRAIAEVEAAMRYLHALREHESREAESRTRRGFLRRLFGGLFG